MGIDKGCACTSSHSLSFCVFLSPTLLLSPTLNLLSPLHSLHFPYSLVLLDARSFPNEVREGRDWMHCSLPLFVSLPRKGREGSTQISHLHADNDKKSEAKEHKSHVASEPTLLSINKTTNLVKVLSFPSLLPLLCNKSHESQPSNCITIRYMDL